jgi:hypothetical protein
MPSTPYLSAVVLAAAVTGVAACSSGSAPLGPLRPIEPDPPYSSQDSPTPSGSCVSCGENFRCTGTVQGEAVDIVYATQIDGPECSIVGSSSRIRCDGQIVSGIAGREKSVGTWTPGPGGGLITCSGGDCITCVPTTDPPTPQQPQPQPGGGNGGRADAG